MMLVRMMYGLILIQNSDQMEFIPHLLLLGHFLLPLFDHCHEVGLTIHI